MDKACATCFSCWRLSVALQLNSDLIRRIEKLNDKINLLKSTHTSINIPSWHFCSLLFYTTDFYTKEHLTKSWESISYHPSLRNITNWFFCTQTKFSPTTSKHYSWQLLKRQVIPFLEWSWTICWQCIGRMQDMVYDLHFLIHQVMRILFMKDGS